MATATESESTPALSPIFDAATRGDIDEVESLLNSDGASCASAVNKGGRTALSLAAQKGHVKCIKVLLAGGGSDSAVGGWTAVHYAAFHGHNEALAVIAAKLGAGALAPSGGGASPPLLLAATRGHVACLATLLDAVPSALNEAVDAHGRTALMCAASGGSAEAVEMLAQRGAELNAVSTDGKTALMWAIVAHKPLTAAALARLGADADIAAPLPDVIVPGQDRSKGETAEMLCNARNNKDPTLRHLSTYMRDWKAARERGEGAPELPPLPWVQHAIETKAKEEAEAKAAAEKAALAADEPLIQEVGEAAAGAPADDENDIFGDVSDVSDPAPVPVGGAAADDEDHESAKAEAEAAAKAIAADADDLDELD